MTESKAIEVLEYSGTYYENMNFGAPKIALDMAIKALEEIQQYRAIGTVSELRELKEKATAKKPLHQGFVYVCPCCNDKVTIGSTLLRINQKYCTECGTEFDWSEGKE